MKSNRNQPITHPAHKPNDESFDHHPNHDHDYVEKSDKNLYDNIKDKVSNALEVAEEKVSHIKDKALETAHNAAHITAKSFEHAKEVVAENVAVAKEVVTEKLHQAKEAINETWVDAKDEAHHKWEQAKERAEHRVHDDDQHHPDNAHHLPRHKDQHHRPHHEEHRDEPHHRESHKDASKPGQKKFGPYEKASDYDNLNCHDDIQGADAHRSCARQCDQRKDTKSPAGLNRWEGEGGAVEHSHEYSQVHLSEKDMKKEHELLEAVNKHNAQVPSHADKQKHASH